MVAIQFGCPWCGAVAEIDAAMSGQQTPCPACNGLLIVPHASPVSRSESASPSDRASPPLSPGNETIVPPPLPTGYRPPLVETVPTKTAPIETVPTAPVVNESAPSEFASPEVRRNIDPSPATKTLDPSDVDGHSPTAAKELAREEILLKEKSRRKVQRNLLMLACGLAILLVALGLLLQLSGK